MFSGIIESMGIVEGIENSGLNKDFLISCPITNEFKIDQSISHNGVCLTVVEINDLQYKVTAINETLNVSNIGTLGIGDSVNLERSIRLSDRLDGHLVQGHVDATSEILNIIDEGGSWRISLAIPEGSEGLLVFKGSICINGVSLTVAGIDNDSFEVTIIPYTFEHTNFKNLKKGSVVNLEFDILGKYILRNLNLGK